MATLKAQVESLKSQPAKEAEPDTKPNLSKVQNVAELEKIWKEAQAAKMWALQNLGREYVEVNGQEYDDDQIRNILTEAEEFFLSEKIPQRIFYNRSSPTSRTRSTPFLGVPRVRGPNGNCSNKFGTGISTRMYSMVYLMVITSLQCWLKGFSRLKPDKRKRSLRQKQKLHLLRIQRCSSTTAGKEGSQAEEKTRSYLG